jgi:hypothetical protein
VTGYTSQSPLLTEQAQTYREIAEARQDIQREVAKLDGQSSELNRNAQTTNDRKSGLDSMDKKSGGSPGGAQGGGSPAGASQASSSPAQNGNLTSSSPSMLAEENPIPASSGQGAKTFDTATGTPSEQNSYNLAGGPGYSGSGANGGYSSGPKNSAGVASTTPPIGEGGDTASAGTGESLDGKTTESSSNLRSSLRDQLARLGAGSSTGSSSMLPGGGKSGEGGTGGADSGKGTSAGGGIGSAGAGGSEGEGDFQAFGSSLGNPKVELSSSETDDSVKKLMEDFENSEGDGRDLASVMEGSGIGEIDGPSLFERLRQVHDRCMQRGCVSGIVAKLKTKI